MAGKLPDFERKEVILMIDQAMANLQLIMEGKVSRRPTPVIDWAKVSHQGDILTYDGRPVFLADWSWKPENSKYDAYHGQLDGFFVTPGYLENSKGQLQQKRINEIEAKKSGTIGFIFINHRNVPNWALEKYGQDFVIKDKANVRYTEYDIDHPGAREMMRALISGVVPRMSGKNYSQLGYMMCNEPHFITTKKPNGTLTWASTGVSAYTLEKFKIWLSKKHQSIQNLNSVWGTDFRSFDEVKVEVPMSLDMEGQPQWYDWMSFNMDRVTDWYSWMKAEIKSADPEAKVHLKVIPKHWSHDERDRGIDMEALLTLTDIVGNDCGTEHRVFPRKTEEWQKKYAFDWTEISMSHDFFKSVQPDQLIFNTEAHYLSTHASLDLELPASHARATYWLAHTHGMDASQTWFWSRREDGSPKNNNEKGYAGSNNMQPRVVNEVHQTIMDLNSFSEEIVAFQRQRKPIRIYYTKASSINSDQHMNNLRSLYEKLYFEGVPLGFVTESILNRQTDDQWDVVLVHRSQLATAGDLKAIQDYINRGGEVIIDESSLLLDEYNRPHQLKIKGAITISDIDQMVARAMEASKDKPAIQLLEHSDFKSCAWKVIAAKNGVFTLSIVNVGKETKSIEIRAKDIEALRVVDKLTGKELDAKLDLPSRGVLFLDVMSE